MKRQERWERPYHEKSNGFKARSGIGEKKEQELIELGYTSLQSLKNADPEELYFRACAKQGWQLDKCVLYAFRCAVAFC